MDRRKLLGAGLLALLALTAGCSADGSLSMRPVDEGELAAQASAELPEDRVGDRAVAREAIVNGTATVVDERPPVDEQFPFRHRGKFYAVNYTESGTEPGWDVNVRIDYNASDIEGEVVAYEDLPEIDQRALASLVEHSDRFDEQLQPGYDFGAGETYDTEEANASALVGGQQYDALSYDGETYPISVTVEETTLTVYRYEATVVANSSGTYARQLRERHEFELTNLSDAERGVVDDALNDTTYMESADNEGFASLVDRFRAQRSVSETEYRGSYVVRYEGQLYWAEMSYGSYVDD
jgi:hypothetical protein